MKNSKPAIAADTINRWMSEVLACAWRGVAAGQHPFAAAVYSPSGEQIAIQHNTVQQLNQITRHGEVNAIDRACETTGKLELSGHVIVSTGEPCPMCAAAIGMADITSIYYGSPAATIQQAGFGSLGISCQDFFRQSSMQISIVGDVRREECDELLLRNPQSKTCASG